MGINREKDHKGRERLVVSKYWPDGSRFRRIAPNMATARKMKARIDEAIAMGTWQKLKAELSRKVPRKITVSDFSEIYLEEYVRAQNKRPDFKRQALASIRHILGKVPIEELRRRHAHHFVTVRSREVAPATVNRGLAVLKHMLSFAVERELIQHNPLLGFRMLPEEQKPLRVMTLEEERRLVEAVRSVNPLVGVYVALLGETGLRKSEGLKLQWSHVDFQRRLLTVEETKSGKVRYVPLSDFAVAQLQSLVRIVGEPYVFVRPTTGKRLRDPRPPFEKGKKLAGLQWVGFHGLRYVLT